MSLKRKEILTMNNLNRFDAGQGREGVGVKQGVNLHDKGQWIGEYKLTKWAFATEIREEAEADLRAGFTKEQILFKYGHDRAYLESDAVIGENLLLNEGINAMLTLLAGGGGTAFNNANAYIGVGDSSTAASASQTALQAASNKLYKAMDGGYPTYGTSQQIVFRSTFASGDANFAWNEFTVANGSSDAGTNLNRLVSSQGTKTSGQTWQVTLTITIT
jgi:hypothetical protein